MQIHLHNADKSVIVQRLLLISRISTDKNYNQISAFQGLKSSMVSCFSTFNETFFPTLQRYFIYFNFSGFSLVSNVILLCYSNENLIKLVLKQFSYAFFH